MSDDDPEVLLHNYVDLLEISQASFPDLQDSPLSEAEADLFPDGSSLVTNGVRSTGAAVTNQWDTIWAQALPQGTSDQKAELMGLTQTLRWGKDSSKRVSLHHEVHTGTSVIALVEENKTTHIQKAIKVKTVTNPVDGTEQSDLDRELCIKCVSSVTQDSIYIDKETSFPVHLFSGEFMPCKGDLLLVEYSMKPGTSNMNIHTMSHLSSQNSDEVCVTTIDGRTGVVEASMFFTLDSLHSHPGYTPTEWPFLLSRARMLSRPKLLPRAMSGSMVPL
ncbi:cancer/testis antigen 55-like [Peromyscus eremicus]|uniref:cancer/testis antigen 55-like n=1 Tax=Peromyscus eremicus TaxID=42410 RepID=UPI0027DCBB46|nr:cancer/testis antigen 55-like [Peromyscus eremicus]